MSNLFWAPNRATTVVAGSAGTGTGTYSPSAWTQKGGTVMTVDEALEQYRAATEALHAALPSFPAGTSASKTVELVRFQLQACLEGIEAWLRLLPDIADISMRAGSGMPKRRQHE